MTDQTTATRPVAVDERPGTTLRRTWTGPEGVAPRGTLVLVVGRGETPGVYERFGRRIADDAYVVVAVADGAEVRAVLADPGLPRPLVVAGSDSGAAVAAAIARVDRAVGGVVLAGLLPPGITAERPGDWEAELESRTACPNHRKVLAARTTGGLWDVAATELRTVPEAPSDEPTDEPLGVPVLAIHGGADRVSPVEDARTAYRELGVDELVVVDGGLHDVLNDVTHRSVAATIVLFLERLRLSSSLGPIVRTEHL